VGGEQSGKGLKKQEPKLILSIPAKRKLKATTRMSLQPYNGMLFVMQTQKKSELTLK
jgi:hypothetical protein